MGYNPVVGTFVERDPVEADPNAYRYVENGPMVATDPSGLGPRNRRGPVRDMVATIRTEILKNRIYGVARDIDLFGRFSERVKELAGSALGGQAIPLAPLTFPAMRVGPGKVEVSLAINKASFVLFRECERRNGNITSGILVWADIEAAASADWEVFNLRAEASVDLKKLDDIFGNLLKGKIDLSQLGQVVKMDANIPVFSDIADRIKAAVTQYADRAPKPKTSTTAAAPLLKISQAYFFAEDKPILFREQRPSFSAHITLDASASANVSGLGSAAIEARYTLGWGSSGLNTKAQFTSVGPTITKSFVDTPFLDKVANVLNGQDTLAAQSKDNTADDGILKLVLATKANVKATGTVAYRGPIAWFGRPERFKDFMWKK
jgi:hypothetical protein